MYLLKQYISATQLVGLFEEEFDTEAEAAKFADKYGATKEYWMERWSSINSVSLERGDKLHNLREFIVRNRSMDVLHGRALPVQNTELFDVNLPLKDYPDGIYVEEPICIHGFEAAGKPDKFGLYTIRVQRFADIDDYKTNRRLRTRSHQFANGSYKMLKYPLNHLMDCEMVKYTLQLSLYMYMLESHGYAPGKMRLIHFPHIPAIAPEGAEEPDPVIYPLEYYRKEVIAMLNYLKQKQLL